MVKAELDLEWLQLVQEALEKGITKTEIRDFLKTHKISQNKNIEPVISKSLA
ncbi:anti-repressor SinI family protein [Bacillus spongiae]|uniref:Anti-repressor SinI family protein n=1 Tax=Bacillus spongiae TaxID=2683610 RepID=A0ABU8HIK3_9BACI